MKKTTQLTVFVIFAAIFLLTPLLGAKQLTSREKLLRQEGQYLVLLEQNPDDITARTNLADIYLKKNNWNKASVHFQKALAAGGQTPAIYIGLAFSQQQLGNIDQATETCLQGISANPENGELHLRLGNLYHAAGQKDDAESEYSLYRQLQKDKQTH